MGKWENSQIPYFSERKFKQIRRKFIPENDLLTQTILKKFSDRDFLRISAYFLSIKNQEFCHTYGADIDKLSPYRRRATVRR